MAETKTFFVAKDGTVEGNLIPKTYAAEDNAKLPWKACFFKEARVLMAHEIVVEGDAGRRARGNASDRIITCFDTDEQPFRLKYDHITDVTILLPID